ncbi:MAG: SnoaL-like domain-containing protein, partial [Ferruginibacter sp.]
HIKTIFMNTQQIADRLAELCKTGDFETAQKELYADAVISIEPMATPDYDKETKGKDAVEAKMQKFKSSVEESYGNEVSVPLVTANAIAFTLAMDIKMKGQDRMKMTEICVYEVKDGKVISEQFFA